MQMSATLHYHLRMSWFLYLILGLLTLGAIFYMYLWSLPPDNIDFIQLKGTSLSERLSLYADELLHPAKQRYVFLSHAVCTADGALDKHLLKDQTLPILTSKTDVPCSETYYYHTAYGAVYSGNVNGLREVSTDVQHFHIFLKNQTYSRDSRNAYFYWWKIQDADLKTFQVVPAIYTPNSTDENTGLSFDAHHVFYQENPLSDFEFSGAPLSPLLLNGDEDSYIGIGNKVYYFCPFTGSEMCWGLTGFSEKTPLKLITQTVTNHPVLIVRGCGDSDYGGGSNIATDQEGTTYFQGRIFHGLTTFATLHLRPCF